MIVATPSPPSPPYTAADVLKMIDRLGGIAPVRVHLHPLPGTATEDDLIRLVEGKKGRPCELVEGTLVEKAMGFEESLLAGELFAILRAFIRPRRLGVVVPADAMMR